MIDNQLWISCMETNSLVGSSIDFCSCSSNLLAFLVTSKLATKWNALIEGCAVRMVLGIEWIDNLD